MEQASHVRLLASVVAAGLLLAASCAAPHPPSPVVLGVGPSVLPNLGLSASAAVRVGAARRATTWLEGELTRQFLDDEDFFDDGNPGAGDWTQLRLGAKLMLPSTPTRDWTLRAGLLWFEARGAPNVVDEAGNYYGAYVGLGFETRVGAHLSVGPEIAVMPALPEGGGGVSFVPQATWRILWRL